MIRVKSSASVSIRSQSSSALKHLHLTGAIVDNATTRERLLILEHDSLGLGDHACMTLDQVWILRHTDRVGIDQFR